MSNTLGLLELNDLVWPVTWTYRVNLPDGVTNLSLTLNVPEYENDMAQTNKTTQLLWSLAIAPAISVLASCSLAAVMPWKVALLPTWRQLDAGQGIRGALPARRERTPCAVLHTGHTDRKARRRIFFPGSPRGWSDGDQLNAEGAGELRTLLAGWFAGFTGTLDNAPFQWLTVYPDALPGPLDGFGSPGFRIVRAVRLCSYTIPYPDAVLADT